MEKTDALESYVKGMRSANVDEAGQAITNYTADFAELGLTPTWTHDHAEDGAGIMGLMVPSAKAIFKQEQFLAPFTGSADTETTSSCATDHELMRLKMLLSSESHVDGLEVTTRSVECDASLILQPRLSVPSVLAWSRKHEETISNRTLKSGKLNSKAWYALGRRFQVELNTAVPPTTSSIL